MMRVEESLVIERSPDEVFAFFDDRGNDQRWLSSVTESQWLDPQETTQVGRRGRSVMDVMGRRDFTDVVTKYVPGRLIEHRQVSGPIVMDTACLAEPHGTGCRVTIAYEPKRFPGGAVGWLVAPFALRTVRRTYRGDLARLKEVLEAGPTAVS
jgi:uncharacterized membrane protein